MKHCRSVLVLLMAIWPFTLTAQRVIPDDNLGYPVRINLNDCISPITSVTGSGFFLNTGPLLYLVTARHVLFNESERRQTGQVRSPQCNKAELLSYSRDPKDTHQNRFQLDLRALSGTGKVKAHATRDIAVVEIGTSHQEGAEGNYSITFGSGVQVIDLSPSGIVNAGIGSLKKFDEVFIANDVYVLGYPSSIGLQQLPQIDYDRPLLRRGIVAGTNNSTKTIVLDGLMFFGNSGGPVLQVVPVSFSSRFDIIGVISQYVPVTETWTNATMNYSYFQVHNSGYSVAESMDAVLELVGK